MDESQKDVEKVDDSADYKSLIEKFGEISFVPRGNSMWPTLKHRGQSVIVRKKGEGERLKRFDVALYKRGADVYVLHRVMNPAEGGYVICGDSQFTLERVDESAVFGVMVGFYKGKKFIPVTDEKYIRRVEKWYKRKKTRKLRLKLFFLRVRIKNVIARIFKGKSER